MPVSVLDCKRRDDNGDEDSYNNKRFDHKK